MRARVKQCIIEAVDAFRYNASNGLTAVLDHPAQAHSPFGYHGIDFRVVAVVSRAVLAGSGIGLGVGVGTEAEIGAGAEIVTLCKYY